MNRRAFLLTPLALAAAARKPNVIVIAARSWRGQATPWAGDPDLHAPNLEKFARQATVFPRAWSAYPDPSRAPAALFTGRYPHAGDGADLDSILAAAGYRAGAQIGTGSTFLDQNGASTFFLRVLLEVPRSVPPAAAAQLHLRDNVPRESEAKAREDLSKRYGAFTALDQEFGKLLAAIDRAGLAQNTVVVFTSYCGEQIDSHGLDGDDTFYEESVRIPLAIRWPGVLNPGPSDLPLSQVDLAPTLLGFCSEEPPEPMQGRNLAQLLMGGKAERPESVFAEGRIGERDEWRLLCVGYDKLVVDASGEATHLFNLAEDPYELTNLVHEPSTNLKRDRMLATMRAERSRLLDFKKH